MSFTYQPDPQVPLRCDGVARIPGYPQYLVLYFNKVPTDDQMRFLLQVVARGVDRLPEDLR